MLALRKVFLENIAYYNISDRLYLIQKYLCGAVQQNKTVWYFASQPCSKKRICVFSFWVNFSCHCLSIQNTFNQTVLVTLEHEPRWGGVYGYFLHNFRCG